jgi:hypothetical protein
MAKLRWYKTPRYPIQGPSMQASNTNPVLQFERNEVVTAVRCKVNVLKCALQQPSIRRQLGPVT